jgi:hypothetical protein
LENPGNKGIRRRSFKTVLIVVILLAPVILGASQYFRVQGFKKALISLVNIETNGDYSLYIRDTDIEYWELSFSLNDIALIKSDTTQRSGILEVRSKQLNVRFGTLASIWAGDQYEIKELSISEPVATVKLEEKQQNDSEDDPVNIGHEVAQFLPGIKSILDNFDIRLFHLDKAEIGLDKSQDHIKIGMLDLLVSNWNMRDLSENAEFRWSLGPQSIDFSNTEFSFSSIVYDYQRNELDVLDYRFIERDSLGRASLDIEGDSLSILDLDFATLIEKEHYIFKQLTISRPQVTAHIYVQEEKEDRVKYPISTLLKRNLSELQVLDCRIVDASMDFHIYGKTDSIHVQLPKVNLVSKDIVVTEDSSTMMIGALHLELDKTVLEPGGALNMQFSKLRYDEDYNLEIDSIRVLDLNTGKELINCEYLELFNFQFFHYYFENDLLADSLVIRNGRLSSNHGAPRLKSNGRQGNGSQRNEPPTIHISKISLTDIDLELDLGQPQLNAQKVSAILQDFNRELYTSYQLNYLRSPGLSFSDPDDEVVVQIKDAFYYGSNIAVGKMQGHYHGLSISLNNFMGHLKENFDLDQPWHYQLNSIELEDISLSGVLPAPKKENKSKPPDLNLQKLRLDSFQLDLASNNNRFYITGNELVIDTPELENGKLALQHAELKLQQTEIDWGQNNLSMGPSRIKSDSSSELHNFSLSLDSGNQLTVKRIYLGQWEKLFTHFEVEKLLLERLEFANMDANKKSTSDSVMFQSLSLIDGQQPYIEKVKIYNPDIHIEPGKQKNPDHKGIDLSPLEMIGQIEIGPGKVAFGEKEVSFKQVNLNNTGEHKEIDLNELAFKSPSTSFHINQVWTTPTSLNVDSITIVPTDNYINHIETEKDVLAGQIYHTRISEIDWDMLLDSSRLVADQLLIDGFDLSIRRDKTLPDPEEITKSYLLSDMVPSVAGLSIPNITTKNGNLSYHEVGEKTGMEGRVQLTDIDLTFDRYKPLYEPEKVLRATAKLYDQGKIQVWYDRLDSGKFALNVRLSDFPLEELNQMVDPLEAAKMESGHITKYEFRVVADSLVAVGEAIISYEDLHVRIFKTGSPDHRTLGSELLTLLVDNIIIKHAKSEASAEFTRDRITYKGPINYWIKIALQGAITAVRKGKGVKTAKR